LSQAGQVAKGEWQRLEKRFPGVVVDESTTIMPQPIHGIIFLPEAREAKVKDISPIIGVKSEGISGIVGSGTEDSSPPVRANGEEISPTGGWEGKDMSPTGGARAKVIAGNVRSTLR